MYKIGIFGILLFAVTVLLIPLTSIANAQQYGDRHGNVSDVYYEDEKYYYEDDYYYNDKYKQYKKQPIAVIESVFCTDSGLFADNYDNCPQKCDDGLYVMKGMSCPTISPSTVIECIDSGFLVTDPENCPTKCPDGTYIMQGMSCPNNEVTQLNVTKQVRCFTQLDEEFDEINCAAPDPGIFPSSFNISVTGNNPNPSNFDGSDTGTNVVLNPGAYEVTEASITSQVPTSCENTGIASEGPFNAGAQIEVDVFICSNFSQECSGTINEGESLECTIKNFRVEIFGD